MINFCEKTYKFYIAHDLPLTSIFCEIYVLKFMTNETKTNVTNENKHVRIEINEQTSHGCKFCNVGAYLPKLIQKLSVQASRVKME